MTPPPGTPLLSDAAPGEAGSAGLDPRLPQLAGLLEPDAAVRLLRPALAPGPGGDLRLLACERHDTRWIPGVSCTAAFRVLARGPGPDVVPHFVALRVTPEGITGFRPDEDPDLPGLAAPDDELSDALSESVGAPVVLRGARPLRYRPGSRLVLRLTVDIGGRPASLVAKISAQGAERCARTTAGLSEALRGAPRRGAGPRVAHPIAVLGGRGLVVSEDLPGRSGREAVFDPAVPSGRRLRLVADLGARLAVLHTVAGVPGPLRTVEEDLAEVRSCLAAVRAGAPALAAQLLRCVEGVERAAGAVAVEVLAPAHGAFRFDQVLIDSEDVVSIVDLDGYGWADPGRDVGNLLAYQRWRAIRRPDFRDFLAAARRAFLGGYAGAALSGGAPGRDSLALWEAVALLKISARRFRSLGTSEWPLVPRLVEAAEELIGWVPAARVAVGAPSRPSREGTGAGRSAETAASGSVAPVAGDPEAAVPVLTAVLPAALSLDRMTAELRCVRLPGGPQPGPTGRSRCGGDASGPSASSPRGGVLVTSAEVLACRPGRRAVVRYSVVTADGVETGVLGKLYPELTAARRTDRIMRRLSEEVFVDSPDLRVPRPLGVVSALNLALYLPVSGRTPDTLAPAAQHTAVLTAAVWLARLHGAPVTFDRRLTVDAEVRAARVWAGVVGAADPDSAPAARRLADRLAQVGPRLPAVSDVPIHKDFHYQHVFVGPGLAVVDLDEVRLGDPAVDVAHFCVNLALLAIRSGGVAAELPAEFRAAYEALTGWRGDVAFDFFRDWARLKLARQLLTGRGPRPVPGGAERSRQVHALLSEDLSCGG